MDFSYPKFCSCHACGHILQFTSFLSAVVCAACGSRNYAPVGEHATIAATQPRIALPTCPCCGCQSFICGEDNAVLCEACGTKQAFRMRGAPVERKFNCVACRWELPIRGKQRVITCPACGTLNTMPEGADDAASGFDFDFDL